MRLNDKAFGIFKNLTVFDDAADKLEADRFYFCIFPEGAISDESYSLACFGFRDDKDQDARREFLLILANSIHALLSEEGLIPDREATR